MKTVQLITDGDAFKALYFDRERLSLRPNLVFVEPDGRVCFATNEVGLKGDPLDPNRRLVVVWGDSVVFGIGWGWAHLLDDLAPGYQFLNGGIDGDVYTNILQRAADFNRQHKVALNILTTGWHPIDSRRHLPHDDHWKLRLRRLFHDMPPPILAGNRKLRERLTEFLRAVPNTVLATMPTALNPGIAGDDLSRYITGDAGPSDFTFAGAIPYSRKRQREFFEHIVERNAIVRAVAAALGIRLVDFAAIFDTTGLDDFRRDFFDILHFRPSAYPVVARRLYEGIADLLQG